MSRIYLDSSWYERAASGSLYESEYEHIVAQNAGGLFPDCELLPFEILVESEWGAAKPDLALVRQDYSAWWVVEVELSIHSFASHVRPQVMRLAYGHYGSEHATWLYRESGYVLDRERLVAMLKGVQPSVLLIVDETVPEWKRELGPFGVQIIIFEPFVSDRNAYAFRVDGQLPETDVDHVSRCSRSTVIPKVLVVEAPGALNCADGDILKIVYRDGRSAWRRVDAANQVWLIPVGPTPVREDGPFELVRRGQELELRIADGKQ